ncbi:hypothetical protein [Halalkalibacter oceani]|uniref:hypothetical protein n=1 Tax=Halalkalibacter oceani TaxID=1653776 RepID=UPI003395431D
MDKKERYYLNIKQTKAYFENRKNKLFNCLCMYEENNDTAFKNIHSLSLELEGKGERLPFLKDMIEFDIILDTLEFLYNEFLTMDNNQEVVRREIFKCMSLLDKMIIKLPDYMECG